MSAVAVFMNADIQGDAVATQEQNGIRLVAKLTKLPPGKHGFHIHKAGDLRGEGCKGACEHFHKGQMKTHGGRPGSHGARHTGDLGNIEENVRYSYFLPNLRVSELWGRSLIIHADEDDCGKGTFEDSTTTGHSGGRIGCAIFGRALSLCTNGTRKKRRTS